MKELIIWFGVLVGMILFAAWLQKGGYKLPESTNSSVEQTKSIKVGNTKKIDVEIADSPQKHEKGLSGRDSLSSGRGMLFIMQEDSMPTFWMKNMKFPIDIMWINDSIVVDILENVPAQQEETNDANLSRYRSQRAVDHVLEVTDGFIKTNGISIGDKVELPEGI